MSTGPDPYSLPMSPAWVSTPGGQRFVVSKRSAYVVPRQDRVLEIGCDGSVIAIVHPRGPQRRWRLQLLDVDEHLWPEDAPPTDEVFFQDLGVDPPSERLAGFKCVCGRGHVLDRDKVLEAAQRDAPVEPRARARLADFSTVAVVLRGPAV